MQDWHEVAEGGSLMRSAIPPHVSAHAVSQLVARHALKAETSLAVPTGLSMVHCDRHFGSPLHLPKHDSYAEHTGSAAQAVDSAQQLVLTHEAHVFVPYGRPQMLVTRSSGGLSVMPTSWRQARTPVIAVTAATSPSPQIRRHIEEPRMYRVAAAARRGNAISMRRVVRPARPPSRSASGHSHLFGWRATWRLRDPAPGRPTNLRHSR